MGTYFDINGTAMIYINTNPSIRNAKTKKEADKAIDKHCQDLVARFKDKLQELTKQNPDIFDEISFEGFYPLGLDIHCFQNHAHGPSTDVFEQSKTRSVIFRTNDILFLDAIRTLAMENDMLDAVTIIHMHKDNTNHWLKFNENGWLNSPCDYNYPLININNRFYRAMYEKRRANK